MSLEESHASQIRLLKDCLEARHNQIVSLEAKVNQLAGSSARSVAKETTATTTTTAASLTTIIPTPKVQPEETNEVR